MTTTADMAPRAPTGPRAASLGTLFFTVFLDLLGFGLVIPFLPGLARECPRRGRQRRRHGSGR